MFNSDDTEPARQKIQLHDLQPLSITELRDYIASLNAEISRAESMIAKKESHKSGAASLLFGD